MNKILFVNIDDNYLENEYRAENLGILSLATVLREKSMEVDVIDFRHEYMFKEYKPKCNLYEEMEQMAQYIMRKKPRLVGFYTLCNNYHIVIMVSRLLKKIDSSIKILFGGPQATLTANESIKNFPWVDAIGIGEGENTIYDIVNTVLKGEDFKDTPGVVYLKDKRVVNNGLPPLIENLDEMPIIKYDFLDIDKIEKVAIDVGRGCPFGCTFCSTKTFWKRKFRMKSSERIIKEIKYLYSKYNIKTFYLTHDLFTANIDRVIEFCYLLKREKMEIAWTCSSRVDTLNEDVIRLMSEAGCAAIFLGIETGSKRMQRIVNKNLDLEKVVPIVKLLKKYNFNYKLSFIYGFPEEKEEDLNQTVLLIRKLADSDLVKYNSIQMHELSFFPETELTNKYKDKLVFAETVNATMLNNKVLTEDIINNMIKKNKFVFPQYFEVNTELRNKYRGLDKFIMLFYLKLLNKYKLTYKLLLNYFNNDLLLLFQSFKNMESNAITNINFYPDNVEYILYEPVESIKRFVLNNYFGNIDNIIKQIAKFEYDIIMFLHKTNEEIVVKQYPIDVYKALQFNDINIDIDNPVTIKFTRFDKKNINVKKCG